MTKPQVSKNNIPYFIVCCTRCREVVECEEFLTLSHHQVSKLISSDLLTVPSEEKVSRVGLQESMYIYCLLYSEISN